MSPYKEKLGTLCGLQAGKSKVFLHLSEEAY